MKSYNEIKKIVERCNKNIFDVIDIDTCVRKVQFIYDDNMNINTFLINEAKTILKTEIESDLHMFKYTNDRYYEILLNVHLEQLKNLV